GCHDLIRLRCDHYAVLDPILTIPILLREAIGLGVLSRIVRELLVEYRLCLIHDKCERVLLRSHLDLEVVGLEPREPTPVLFTIDRHPIMELFEVVLELVAEAVSSKLVLHLSL